MNQKDIYDDFKVKKPFVCDVFFTNLFSASRVNTGNKIYRYRIIGLDNRHTLSSNPIARPNIQDKE